MPSSHLLCRRPAATEVGDVVTAAAKFGLCSRQAVQHLLEGRARVLQPLLSACGCSM